MSTVFGARAQRMVRRAAARGRRRRAPAPAIVPSCSASSSAASSTIGPREVLTRSAVGFMRRELARRRRARGCAVAEHEVDGDDVGAAEQLLLGHGLARRASAARSAVRFWLQAIDVHAERAADAGHRAAEPAQPDDAERARRRARCRCVCCQPPARTAASSCGTCRGDGEDQRPGQLGRWRSARPPRAADDDAALAAAASRSIDALRMPVVTSSRRLGSRSSTLARERRALAHRDDDVERRERARRARRRRRRGR